MTLAMNSTPMTPRMAQPWRRWLPTIRPNTLVSGTDREDRDHLARSSTARWVPRKGCAAFALKKPPPFSPSILIAICEATGPTAMVCLRLRVVVSTYGPSVCGALPDEKQRIDNADGRQDVRRAARDIDQNTDRPRGRRSRGSMRSRGRCPSRRQGNSDA